MEICYYALKKIEVSGIHGVRTAEAGDLIPEAALWPFINGYVQEGTLAVCRVSSLYEDEQQALEEWENTGHFTLYDERITTMAQRDMRLTSSVQEDERIDGSDEAVEGEGLPEPEVVDDSSESTPTQIEMVEEDVEGEEGETEEVDDYNNLTVAELKAELDSRGIAYNSSASKADLVALLEQDDAS